LASRSFIISRRIDSIEGVEWIGVDWSGLEWIGVDWSGLEWIGKGMERKNLGVERMGEKNEGT